MRTVAMPVSSTTRFQNRDVVAASKWNWNECPDHWSACRDGSPKSLMSIFVPLFLTKKSTTFVPIGLAFAFAMKAMIS